MILPCSKQQHWKLCTNYAKNREMCGLHHIPAVKVQVAPPPSISERTSWARPQAPSPPHDGLVHNTCIILWGPFPMCHIRSEHTMYVTRGHWKAKLRLGGAYAMHSGLRLPAVIVGHWTVSRSIGGFHAMRTALSVER